MNLYFDESGNTGNNLIDIKQLYFCLASNNFTEEEATYLLSYIQTQSDEIHFKTLIKSAKHRDSLVKLFDDDLIAKNRIVFNYADKAFALIYRLVDKLIEPFYNNCKLDFYIDKDNVQFGYLLYYELKKEAKLQEYLNSFQRMSREKTSASINEFYNLTDRLFRKTKLQHLKTCLYIINSSKTSLDLSTDLKYSLDLTTSFCVSNIAKWGEIADDTFTIYHDNSKAICEDIELLKKYRDVDETKKMSTEFGFTVPHLRFNEIKLVDSKDYTQVQVSDLIASTITYLWNSKTSKKNEDFIDKMLKTKLCTDIDNVKSMNPLGIVEEYKSFNIDKFNRNVASILNNIGISSK